MLSKLQRLRVSLTAEQGDMLHDALPENIVKMFFAANDEMSAGAVVESLNEFLGARPIVAIKLYRELLPEQRALISDLAFDDDE